MKVVKSYVENEDEGKINWFFNGGVMYVVVNKDKKNKYGEYFGYRIVLGQFCFDFIVLFFFNFFSIWGCLFYG